MFIVVKFENGGEIILERDVFEYIPPDCDSSVERFGTQDAFCGSYESTDFDGAAAVSILTDAGVVIREYNL